MATIEYNWTAYAHMMAFAVALALTLNNVLHVVTH